MVALTTVTTADKSTNAHAHISLTHTHTHSNGRRRAEKVTVIRKRTLRYLLLTHMRWVHMAGSDIYTSSYVCMSIYTYSFIFVYTPFRKKCTSRRCFGFGTGAGLLEVEEFLIV